MDFDFKDSEEQEEEERHVERREGLRQVAATDTKKSQGSETENYKKRQYEDELIRSLSQMEEGPGGKSVSPVAPPTDTAAAASAARLIGGDSKGRKIVGREENDKGEMLLHRVAEVVGVRLAEFEEEDAARARDIEAIQERLQQMQVQRGQHKEERRRKEDEAKKKEEDEVREKAAEKEEVEVPEATWEIADELADGSLAPLTATMEAAVEEALSPLADGAEILVRHQEEDLTRSQLQCLQPNDWLNNEVINVYLVLLKEREQRNSGRFPTCHFFNSFFFTRLVSKGYDYKSVRRWTTQKKLGYQLKDCNKVIVPVHKHIHWALAVIDLKSHRLSYYDSLGAVDEDTLNILMRYMADETQDKSNERLDISNWEQHNPGHSVPQQANGYDCGVFMLKFADYESRGLSFNFSQKHMPYFRRRIVWELLQGMAK